MPWPNCAHKLSQVSLVCIKPAIHCNSKEGPSVLGVMFLAHRSHCYITSVTMQQHRLYTLLEVQASTKGLLTNRYPCFHILSHFITCKMGPHEGPSCLP